MRSIPSCSCRERALPKTVIEESSEIRRGFNLQLDGKKLMCERYAVLLRFTATILPVQLWPLQVSILC